MDESAVSAVLSGMPQLSAIDADLSAYLASLISMQPAGTSAADLAETVGPFLESAGVADDEDGIAAVCAAILARVSGTVVPTAGVRGPTKSRAAGAASAGGGGRRGRRGRRGKDAAPEAAHAPAADPAPDAGASASASSGAGGDEDDFAAPKLLAKAVNVGRREAEAAAKDSASGMLDFLWGREDNAFLNQNGVKEFVLSAKEEEKYAKRVERWKKRQAAMERKTKKGRRGYVAPEPSMVSAAGGAAPIAAPVDFAPVSAEEEASAARNIDIEKFTMGFGSLSLLENTDLKIILGRKYGLIGQNGSGKTTLLRQLARREIIGLPPGLTILHVQQEVRGTEATVLDTVMASDVEREALMREEETLGLAIENREITITELESRLDSMAAASAAAKPAAPTKPAAAAAKGAAKDAAASADAGDKAASAAADAGAGPAGDDEALEAELAALHKQDDADTARVNEIYERLERLDAASAEARAAEVLGGLGFTTLMQRLPTRALSGGWRMRVALACALFVRPDVLCLDEPTNHVDFPAIAWLEDYLSRYKSTCLIVSHDRHFLNHVATDIVHLTNKKLAYYRGNYDEFIEARSEKMRHSKRAAAAADAKRAHIQEFITKFRANAKKASLVQSRIKALTRIESVTVASDDPAWSFEFPEPAELDGASAVLQIKDVGFGYDPSRMLFRGVNFGVSLDSRIGILGPNGVGKSTLIKLVMGQLSALEGAVTPHPKVKIAFFSQHHEEGMDLEMSPLEMLVDQNPGTDETAARAHLGRFNLSGELALQRIGSLSGGQKSRVSFALMSYKAPHVLVMDEVTNHLDIETVDALISAIAMYQGGIVIVSHDQHFLEATCTEYWVLNSTRKLERWRGTLAAYRRIAESEKPVVQFTHPDAE